MGEKIGNASRGYSGLTRAGERVGDRPLSGTRCSQGVGSRAADVMLVLRDVGEMREKAERPYDLQRFERRQSVERRFELTPRRDVFVATEAD